MENKKKEEGLRFNEGKLRYDLVPSYAQQQYVKVLTKGSVKYAERNWEKGMKWSTVMASLKRHIAQWESGEDTDFETGIAHTSHIMCNAAFLTEYYKIYPQGDDRPHHYLQNHKIGLDIDDVCADFTGHWCATHGIERPESWNFDYDIAHKLAEASENKEFWLSIPPKINPLDMPFEPHCYITARSIPTEWTQEWLQKNKFPTMKVYTVPLGTSKVETAKASGIDIFVDDSYKNFIELNKAGVFCYLMSAVHNQRYNVGYKRLNSLSELIK